MWAVKFIAILALIVMPASAQYYDQQATQLLQAFDREMRQTMQSFKKIAEQSAVGLTPVQELERKMIAVGSLKKIQRLGQDAKRRIAAIPIESLRNETLKRFVKRLKVPGVDMLNPIELNEVIIAQASAESMPLIRNKLYKGLAQQRPEAVLQSWRQVKSETEKYFDNVGTFVKIVSNLARLGDYGRPSDFYYAEYENPYMIMEFEGLINELKPLYEKVHAYIRHKLSRAYGPQVVSETDGIPIHLYEKVMAFGWKKNGLLGSPYPDQECPNYDQKLAQQRYTPQRLYELASAYYVAPLITNNFWSELVQVNQNESCLASVAPFLDEVKITRCEGADFGRFLEAHGAFTSWVYFNEQAKLPTYAQGELCPGMADALAYTVALSASSPKYLSKKGIVPNHPYNEQLAVNRQFRMGVRFLMELHVHFVHEKLLVELMNREISSEEANCRYWELMNQYVGVIPPNGQASARDLDFSVLFYEGINYFKPHSTLLFSEPLSYNFLAEVCLTSLQYDPNQPGKELDNCDLSDQLDWMAMVGQVAESGTGAALEDVMEAAGLEHSDGIRFDASGINRYYSKLSDWLQRTNRNNRVREGWNIRGTCQ